MGRVITFLLVLIGLIAVLGIAAFFVFRRDDIAYETLASRYETAASRYIDLPSGVHLHYRETGATNAPTLILLHGYAASLHTWDAWIPLLETEYHVISIDLPGHGLTRAPAGYQANIPAFAALVEEFAEAKQLGRFALIGNSMGGNTAWEYALAHPERLDALVLVNAAGWPGEGASEPIAFKLIRFGPTANVLRAIDTGPLIRQGLQQAFADQALVTDAMVTQYTELSRAPGHRDIMLQLLAGRSTRDPASAERLAPITTPTLILQGDRDNLIDPRHAESFRDAIAGSQLHMFTNVGHVPQEEIPEDSANVLKEFLYQVYEGSALAPSIAAQ